MMGQKKSFYLIARKALKVIPSLLILWSKEVRFGKFLEKFAEIRHVSNLAFQYFGEFLFFPISCSPLSLQCTTDLAFVPCLLRSISGPSCFPATNLIRAGIRRRRLIRERVLVAAESWGGDELNWRGGEELWQQQELRLEGGYTFSSL